MRNGASAKDIERAYARMRDNRRHRISLLWVVVVVWGLIAIGEWWS